MSRKAAIWLGAGMLLWFGVLRGVRAAKVTFDKLRIVKINLGSIVYRISVFVHNPLLIDILVNDIQGEVYIMNEHVATIDYPVNQRIRSFATTGFDVEFEAYTNQLSNAIAENIMTGDPRTLLVMFDGYIVLRGIKIPIRKEFTYDEIFEL